MGAIPSVAKMFDVTDRGFDRRNFGNVVRRLKRKDRSAAIDTRMTEPTFRRAHQTQRHFSAAIPSERSDGKSAIARPLEVQRSRRELTGRGEIKEAGQHFSR